MATAGARTRATQNKLLISIIVSICSSDYGNVSSEPPIWANVQHQRTDEWDV